MDLRLKVQPSGPLFRPDAPEQVKRMMRGVIKELLQKGEERLAQVLRPRPAGVYLSVAEAGKGKASTGNYRRNVHTLMEGPTGIITDGGVVYGPWLEGVSPRNQSTRFKGYASFRKTRDWLSKRVRAVTDAHARRFARRMNG